MKILYITPRSPYDRQCGGGVRSGFLLKALEALGDVTIVSGLTYALKWKIPWPLLLPIMYVPRLMDKFYLCREEVLRRLGLEGLKFDCVVVRYVGPMNTSAAWKIAPCYLDIDDLPSQAIDTLRRKTDSWLKRKVLVALMRIWQTRLIRRAAGFWICNPSQIEMLKHLGRFGYLPNVAEPPAVGYSYEHVGPLQLLTVGGMSYAPNHEGVDWFIDKVWPRILKAHPDAVYNIVGGGTPSAYAEKWVKVDGVKLWGFVDHLADRYEVAGEVIAPIFSGAGTCIKVLEAALHGRKVFATPFGARGLNDAECQSLGVSVCRTADEFVAQIEGFMSCSADAKRSLQVSIALSAAKQVSFDRFAEAVKCLIEGVK